MKFTQHLKVAALSCAFAYPAITFAQPMHQEAMVDQATKESIGRAGHRVTVSDLLPRLADLTGKRIITFDGTGLIQPIVITGGGDVKDLPLEAIYTAFVANSISTVESGDDIVVGATSSLVKNYAGFEVVGPGVEFDRSNPSALIVKIFSFADTEAASAASDYLYDILDGAALSLDVQRAQLAVLGPVVQCSQIEKMLAKSILSSGSRASHAASLVSLSFSGGLVSDYVKSLQAVQPKLSVLVGADAGSIQLPAIELHQVSARSALMVLDGLSPAGDVLKAIHVMETTPYPSVGGEPVFQLTLHEASARGRGSSSSPYRRTNELGLGRAKDWNVWSIRSILSGELTSDDILATMQEGLAMVSSDGPAAELSYDNKTGLLMAAGTPAQVVMVGRMIERMPETK
ncbi:MAG: hypothetical protein P8J86_11170 [Phycisphaerales bacterium]|nr:hypothetical protein [Phycisphaerales bacterium]